SISAADHDRDALAGARAVAAREDGSEGGRAARFCRNAERVPERSLRVRDRFVGDEDDLFDELPRDGKDALADSARRERVGGDAARWRVDRLARCEPGSE